MKTLGCRWHAGVAVLLSLAACTGDLTRPSRQDSPLARVAASGTEDGSVEVEDMPRFTVLLEPQGPFRPGVAVPVRVSVTANITTQDAVIRLQAPELEALRDEGLRLPAARQVTAAHEFSAAMAAGQTLTRTVAIRFPSPGYFRVSLRASAGSQGPYMHLGRPIVGTAVTEAWIWVHPDSGRAFSQFDRSVFGAGYQVIAGPRRPLVHARLAPPSGPHRAAAGDCDTWRYIYWNDDIDQYQVIPAGVVTGVITEDQTGATVGQINTTVGSDGYFVVCAGPGRSYSGSVRLLDAYVAMVGAGAFSYFSGGSGGGTFDLVAESRAAHVFSRLRDVSAIVQSQFGRPVSSQPAEVAACPGSPGKSCYEPGPDRIFIAPDMHVWGAGPWDSWPRFIQAHEFGHAYHHHALGGMGSNTCPSPHYLDTLSNIGCAYREGIPSLVAIVGAGSVMAWDTWFEQDQGYTEGLDGAQIEGAVTSFLQDLVDSPSSPDGISADDDDVTYPASYIGDAILTCQVAAPSWQRANGIDHLVYCLERQLDPVVLQSPVYFAARSPDPSAYWENATEPPTWSASAIRTEWTWNMYGGYTPPAGGGGGGLSVITSISGPSEVPVSVSCPFIASASGGTEPYTLQWYVDGILRQNGGVQFYWSAASSYNITLVATDALGAPGTGYLSVSINQYMPSCNEQ